MSKSPPSPPLGSNTPAARTPPDHIPLATIDAGDFRSWLNGTKATQVDGADADVPCGDCNGCCKSFYFIHVTPNDTAALAAIPEELLFAAPGAPPGHLVMGYTDQGHCPMLVEDRCSIYSARPQTCRAYDCRIFSAAGMQPGETDKALVSERTARWEFRYTSAADQATQQAIERAATWLTAEREAQDSLLPKDFVPGNSTQLAVLALQTHHLFAAPDQSSELPRGDFAAAVVAAASL